MKELRIMGEGFNLLSIEKTEEVNEIQDNFDLLEITMKLSGYNLSRQWHSNKEGIIFLVNWSNKEFGKTIIIKAYKIFGGNKVDCFQFKSFYKGGILKDKTWHISQPKEMLLDLLHSIMEDI